MTLEFRGVENLIISKNNKYRFSIPCRTIVNNTEASNKNLELYLQVFELDSEFGVLYTQKPVKKVFIKEVFLKRRSPIIPLVYREIAKLETTNYILGYGEYFIITNQKLGKKILSSGYTPDLY